MKYAARESILCFSKDELQKIYKASKIPELIAEMTRRQVSFDDLRNNPTLMEEIANVTGSRGANDRDEHEVFAALFSFSRFYEPDCEVCFEVNRNFDPKNSQITTLADLNQYRQGVNTSDFMIKSEDGFRKFELKRYRNEIDAEHISEFIKNKITHYANDLGDTNLLIQLQGEPYGKFDVDFHYIHEDLKQCGYTFKGEVLISFNHNNEKHVLVQVYPKLTKHEIPIVFPSNQ